MAVAVAACTSWPCLDADDIVGAVGDAVAEVVTDMYSVLTFAPVEAAADAAKEGVAIADRAASPPLATVRTVMPSLQSPAARAAG